MSIIQVLKRAWRLVLPLGLAVFVLADAGLTFFFADATAGLVNALPPAALSALTAAFAAQGAVVRAGAFVFRAKNQEIAHLRSAIESMPQGLCMFDAAERLVVCNSRYASMYELTEDEVPAGATLSE